MLQLIATQMAFHTTVSQPNDVQLVAGPGWELFLELFSEFGQADGLSTDTFFGLYSILTILDKVQIAFASNSGGNGMANIHSGAEGTNKQRPAESTESEERPGTSSDNDRRTTMESDPQKYTEEETSNFLLDGN